MTQQPTDLKAVLREYIESLILAILVAIVLRSFVITAYKIPTPSMLPTLKVGDFIFAFKLPYGVDIPFMDKKWATGQTPRHGEIIVFKHPKDSTVSYIKRVIGLPGDKIQVKEGQLIVNDRVIPHEKLPEAQLSEVSATHTLYVEKLAEKPYAVVLVDGGEKESFGPLLVPPGQVFVMGDNRVLSDDSRNWGPVSLESIEGRVVMIWMSMDWSQRESGWPDIRWKRIFQVPN